MYDRGRTLGEAAAKAGVRLLIDAEQVRYQPAIDNLVLELQRQFNVDDKPIITTRTSATYKIRRNVCELM